MNLRLIVDEYRVAVLLYFTFNMHQCKNHLHRWKRVIQIFGSQSWSQSIWTKHQRFCGLDILDKGDRAYLSGGAAIQNQLISIHWLKLINWNLLSPTFDIFHSKFLSLRKRFMQNPKSILLKKKFSFFYKKIVTW